MTPLTSLIRHDAPVSTLRVSAGRTLRTLVVVCLSALVTIGFVLDVAGGAAPRPERSEARQAVLLT